MDLKVVENHIANMRTHFDRMSVSKPFVKAEGNFRAMIAEVDALENWLASELQKASEEVTGEPQGGDNG